MSIETEDALRDHYPAQSKIVRLKTLPAIDVYIERFISLSPFLVIGSSHPDRGTDVSPCGDAPGFVQVTDLNTLVIPDRPGNNRLDTLSNITANPEVGLVFMIPGVEETARADRHRRCATSRFCRQRRGAAGRDRHRCDRSLSALRESAETVKALGGRLPDRPRRSADPRQDGVRPDRRLHQRRRHRGRRRDQLSRPDVLISPERTPRSAGPHS